MQKDPQLGIEPRTFLLQGNSATNCATVQPSAAGIISPNILSEIIKYLFFYIKHVCESCKNVFNINVLKVPFPFSSNFLNRPFCSITVMHLVCTKLIFKRELVSAGVTAEAGSRKQEE
ncbi:hypothetical protein AMECASPLE_035757 [Ameca splendens]|uniref:Uncharacterized protein n=1 Tax=Ameca splendens TaxID=208324 RepID=A0ABV0YUJ7_9TELE